MNEEEDAVRHSESENDPNEPEDNFIFQSAVLCKKLFIIYYLCYIFIYVCDD